MEKKQLQQKILILGDFSVGKTNLLSRIADNTFNENCQPTLGMDFKIKTFPTEFDEYSLKLTIWDTAGQEKFRSITQAYYNKCDAVIYVYSIDNIESFDHIKHWNDQIKQHSEKPQLLKFLVGNKCDLEHRITTQQGQDLADYFKISFTEISCKTGEGIQEFIKKLGNTIIDSIKQKELKQQEEQLRLQGGNHPIASGCKC